LKSFSQSLQNNNSLKLAILSIFLSFILITSGSSIVQPAQSQSQEEQQQEGFSMLGPDVIPVDHSARVPSITLTSLQCGPIGNEPCMPVGYCDFGKGPEPVPPEQEACPDATLDSPAVEEEPPERGLGCDKFNEEMDVTEAKLRKIVTAGQIPPLWRGVASDNLERFLSGQGGVKIIDGDWLRSFPQVKAIEKSLQNDVNLKIQSAAPKVQRGTTDTITLSYPPQSIIYKGSFYLEELYWASGSSQIKVDGILKLSRTGNIVEVDATLNYHWEDQYDWDVGKGVYIPTLGRIEDVDTLFLQECRGAKPFLMVSDWVNLLTKTITLQEEEEEQTKQTVPRPEAEEACEDNSLTETREENKMRELRNKQRGCLSRN
jgi:uncharacterized membrane protein